MASSKTDCFGQTPLHHAARFQGLEKIKAILSSSQQVSHQMWTKWINLHVEATLKYAECLKDIENDTGSLTSFPKMSYYSWMHDAKFGDVIAHGTYSLVEQTANKSVVQTCFKCHGLCMEVSICLTPSPSCKHKRQYLHFLKRL